MQDTLEGHIGSLTIRIDRMTCIGSANCIKVAPMVFELDDERIVRFVSEASTVGRERIIEACSVCPVAALSVIDENGLRIVPA